MGHGRHGFADDQIRLRGQKTRDLGIKRDGHIMGWMNVRTIGRHKWTNGPGNPPRSGSFFHCGGVQGLKPVFQVGACQPVAMNGISVGNMDRGPGGAIVSMDLRHPVS